MKVRFEAEINDKIIDEVKSWGLSLDELVKDSMEHSIIGSLRRKTDNLCRECKKPIESSIPAGRRMHVKDFCVCRRR